MNAKHSLAEHELQPQDINKIFFLEFQLDLLYGRRWGWEWEWG